MCSLEFIDPEKGQRNPGVYPGDGSETQKRLLTRTWRPGSLGSEPSSVLSRATESEWEERGPVDVHGFLCLVSGAHI